MPDFDFDNLAGGLNYRDPYTLSGKSKNPLYWVEAKNVKPFKSIGLCKCRGNTLIKDHGTKIISAGNYIIGSNEYIMYCNSSGSVHEYDTEAAQESAAIVTGLDTSARGAWACYNKGIIYSNGVDEPFIYFRNRSTTVTGTVTINGTTTVEGAGTSFDTELQVGDSITINGETKIISSITDADTLIVRSAFSGSGSGKTVTRNKVTWMIAVGADGRTLRSTAIAVYKGRVYLGDSEGIYWTAQGTYKDWTTAEDAGYNLNFSDVQALSVFGNYLAIHRKEQKGQVVLLKDTDGTTANFVFEVKCNRGSNSQFGTLTVLNDHIFDDAGIFPLGETGLLNQIILKSEISDIINNKEKGLLNGLYDTARADEVTLLENKDQKEIWCYFPITNVTYLQYVYVYDYQRQMWYRRISPQNTTCAIEHKNGIYSFDTSGKIYKEDLGADWNTTDMKFYVQTAFINFGESHLDKDIDEIRGLIDTNLNNDFDYYYLFDYDNFKTTELQNIVITGASETLIWSDEQGTITDTVWDDGTGTVGHKWAEEVTDSFYMDNYNGLQGLSIFFSGEGVSQDLGVVSLKFRGVSINSK